MHIQNCICGNFVRLRYLEQQRVVRRDSESVELKGEALFYHSVFLRSKILKACIWLHNRKKAGRDT